MFIVKVNRLNEKELAVFKFPSIPKVILLKLDHSELPQSLFKSSTLARSQS